MRLGELVAGIGPVDGAGAETEIAALAYDSREAQPGTLFFCVPGYRSDGHEFAAQAVASGAAALVVERPLGLGVPEVMVACARTAMGQVAARFYGDPTRRLRVVGITGTNGKTTTAFLVRALLQAAGEQTGLLGTVTSIVGGEKHPAGRTTPEAIDLQAGFSAMLRAGDRACAMEVSSHALALHRTDGIGFAAAVFTNLTQDHLDYHATMEDYYQAKRLLFLPGEAQRAGVSVINVGDAYGRRLAGEIASGVGVAVGGLVTFAVEGEHGGEDLASDGASPAWAAMDRRQADYRATNLRCDAGGCHFTLHAPGWRPGAASRAGSGPGGQEISLPMPGRFNVANALGALAAVHALGFDLDKLVAALERGVRVPGRFERVDGGQEFAVLVDYAHTPDSLDNVLHAAREIARGRVICVFGAGGDRDRGKRPLMGEIAARLADVTFVTSDNPRSESPEAIVAEILAGISASEGSVQVEADRRTAIEQAIALARTDDVVVIAGKGHEQGQELAEGVRLPFDDATVARDVLCARKTGVGTSK